ncbi:MAG: DUF1579 family protein [Acidobacteriota bacterium]
MPRPGDPHKRLAGFIGAWSGVETLHPSPWDPAGGTATAKVTNRWGADGFIVVQDYEQTRGGVTNFRGHGVLWYDSGAGQYVMHWWDSMGGAGGEYRGTFEGSVLTLGAPMPQGGHSRTMWDLTTQGSYTFKLEVSTDGLTWRPAIEGQYLKVKAAAPAPRAAATKSAPKKKAASGKKAAPKKAAPRKKAAPKKKAAARKKAAKGGKRR